VIAVVVPSVWASNNCVDINCLKQKLERICKEGTAPPSYLDFENILRYMNGEGEQEIMKCATGYLVCDSYNSSGFDDLFLELTTTSFTPQQPPDGRFIEFSEGNQTQNEDIKLNKYL
jgi:hypothetical protein